MRSKRDVGVNDHDTEYFFDKKNRIPYSIGLSSAQVLSILLFFFICRAARLLLQS